MCAEVDRGWVERLDERRDILIIDERSEWASSLTADTRGPWLLLQDEACNVALLLFMRSA